MKCYCVIELWHANQTEVLMKRFHSNNYGIKPMVLEGGNCNECKHQLACLLFPECDRTYESK